MVGTRVLKDGCSFWSKSQCSRIDLAKVGCNRAGGLSVDTKGKGYWCMKG